MIQPDVIYQICKIDAAFEPLVAAFPDYPLIDSGKNEQDFFKSLVLTIIGQQLSGKAAKTISNRLSELVSITPTDLLATDPDQLRTVGLSGAKAKSILALSEQLSAGLNLNQLVQQHPDEIREKLIQIWGIGNWTIDMFLMFDLYHPDIWPVNDLGVQKGWQRLHGLSARPTPAELGQYGEKFLGLRSAVAWYCWRALEL